MHLCLRRFIWSTLAILLSSAFLIVNTPTAEAGNWYKVRNRAHNSSRGACINGVRISRWEVRRAWRGRRGGCWAYIASSRAEYQRLHGRGARANTQRNLNRRCARRYGQGYYWSSSRKRCIHYGRGIDQSRRREAYRRRAHKVCGPGNYVYSSRGYRCISAVRRPGYRPPKARRRSGSGTRTNRRRAGGGARGKRSGPTCPTHWCGGGYNRSNPRCAVYPGTRVCPKGYHTPVRGCCRGY